MVNLKKAISVIGLAMASPFLLCESACADGQDVYISPYIGAFEVLRSPTRFLGGVEVRAGRIGDYFVPKAGLFVTNKSARYFYGGLNLDLPLNDALTFTPGFAVGAYGEGDGKRLGGTLEFRSSLELSYKLPSNQHRVGVAFSHISNAGIYKKNPGVEDLVLVYSIPVM